MKKSNIIIGLIIGMCVLFVGGYYGVEFVMEKNVFNKKIVNDKLKKQQQEEAIKNGVEDVKKIITSESDFSYDDFLKVDIFINKYKDDKLVKNDLSNFIMGKVEEYLNGNADNKETSDKMQHSIDRLYSEYPDNKAVVDLRLRLYEKIFPKSEEEKNEDTSTQVTKTTSAKLTSYDGMLELENNYPEDDYVCGTIKNLSNRPYSYVQVNVNLYDENGNQIDSTFANVANLEAYGTWHFEAIVINSKRVSKYRIISIEGMR